MAQGSSFTFRIGVEGASQVTAAFNDASASAEKLRAALNTVIQSSPQLASVADGVSKKVNAVAVSLKASGDAAQHAAEQTNEAGGKFHEFLGNIGVAAKEASGPFGEFAEEFLKGGVLGAGFEAGEQLFRRLAEGVRELVQTIPEAGDSFRLISAQLEAVTGSATLASESYNHLAESAAETGISVKDSVAPFIQLFTLTRELGASSGQVANVLRSVQEIGIVSGASVEKTNTALDALARGLGSGGFQARELRSLMTDLPVLARDLATELGTDTSGLQEMAAAGKLSSDTVFPALLRVGEKFEDTFEKVPPTIGRASGQLSAAMDEFLVGLDHALGLSQRIAGTLEAGANWLRKGNEARAQISSNPADRASLAPDELKEQLEKVEEVIANFDQPQILKNNPYSSLAGGDFLPPDLRKSNLAGLENQKSIIEQAIALQKQVDDAQAKEQDEAAAGRQAAQVATAKKASDALRLQLDQNFKIRQEYQERVDTLKKSHDLGALDDPTYSRLTGLARQSEETALAGLGKGGPPGGVMQDDQEIGKVIDGITQKIQDQGQKLKEELDGSGNSVVKLTEQIKALDAAGTLWFTTQGRDGGPLGLSPQEVDDLTTKAYGNFYATLSKVNDKGQDTKQVFEQFFDKTASGFEDAIAKGEDFRKVLQGLEQDVARIITREAIEKPLSNAIGGYVDKQGGIGGILSGLWNTLFGVKSAVSTISIGGAAPTSIIPQLGDAGGNGIVLPDITASRDGNVMTSRGPMALFPMPFADGGVMSGRGAVPLRRYAYGGVADAPQVALFGEGSMPEAYVPLPDGRSIPVTMAGGGGGGITMVHGGVTVNVGNSNASPAQIGAVVAMASSQANAQMLAQIERGGTVARQVGRRR